jgi:hypothetical protein
MKWVAAPGIYKDLIPMKKEQLDLTNATVWIPDSKTPNGVAEVPLTPQAVEAFHDQIRLSPCSPYLFPSDQNPSGHLRTLKTTWEATFAEFAQVLIGMPLRAHDPIGVDLDQSLYALDSTTIDLCLSLFPGAKFRQRKAALKMHTLLDLHGNIPTFIRVTSGDVHDVNILDEIMPEAGAFYVMDRGHIDFQRRFVFTLSSAFFVVRTKSNVLILSCLNWKWRERSSVKITERTYEKRAQALHR